MRRRSTISRTRAAIEESRRKTRKIGKIKYWSHRGKSNHPPKFLLKFKRLN
jgi:hypothetical protein